MDMVKETLSGEKTHTYQSLFPWIFYDMILIEAVKWNLILLFPFPKERWGEQTDVLAITVSSAAREAAVSL